MPSPFECLAAVRRWLIDLAGLAGFGILLAVAIFVFAVLWDGGLDSNWED